MLSRLGVERELGVTGGIAKNVGIVKRLEGLLGFAPLVSPLDAPLAGALGAALFADAIARKRASGPPSVDRGDATRYPQ
jgi:benzoyl-CoA reductase subunit A